MDILSTLVSTAITVVILIGIVEGILAASARLVGRYRANLAGVRKFAYTAIVIVVLIPLSKEIYPVHTYIYYVDIAQVLAVGYLIYKVFNKVVSNITSGLVKFAGQKFYSNIFIPMRKLGNATILILIFLAAVNVSGVNLSPLLFGWGFALFIFALAIQGILGDIVAGLYILLTRPFGIGDVVQFPGGETYEILDIKDQRTVLRDLIDQEIINYSNLDLLKLKLTRLEGRASSLVVPVQVKGGKIEDIEKAKDIISEVAADLPYSKAEYDAKVYLVETSQPNAKFEVMLSLDDVGKRREALDWFNTNLVRRFGAEGLQASG